jgi:acyl-CoA reductase-like NAD-dependent aldehyde dehydrogenase
MHESILDRDRLTGVCPIDLRPLDPVPVTGELEVRSAVERARAAQREWAALSFDERARALKKGARRMLELREDAVWLLRQEVGKSAADVLMNEALGPMDYLAGWIKVARPALAPKKLPISRAAFPGKSGRVEMVPRGVIGVIAPWNFPLAYFFKPVFPALLAGNGVVIKPSEHAPRTAIWFAARLAEFLPPGLLRVIPGGPDTGRALIRAGIDALTFTGSVKTGREVAKAAAEAMIPVSAELGGKDPAIVLPDCNLERTVAGIAHWALANAGQSCSAIERVYVLDAVADRFVPLLASTVSRLATEPRKDGSFDVGPLVTRAQLAIVEAQVADAKEKGARILCGGARTGHGLGYQPTVIDRCDRTMRVVTEETFGPLIAVVRVATVEEAIAGANDSLYGLNASIWSEDREEAERIAERLEAGVVLVNNHSITGAMPAAPWSGVKQTGYGIANSVYALGTFTRPKTYLTDSQKTPDPWWMPMDAMMEELGERLADAQLGKYWRAIKVPLLLGARSRRIARFVRGEPESKLLPIERRWAELLYDAVYPANADQRFGERARGADLVADLDDMLENLAPLAAVGLRAAFWFHAAAPLLLYGKPLTAMSQEERLALIERIGSSNIYLLRQLGVLLKASGAMTKVKTSYLRPVPEAH